MIQFQIQSVDGEAIAHATAHAILPTTSRDCLLLATYSVAFSQVHPAAEVDIRGGPGQMTRSAPSTKSDPPFRPRFQQRAAAAYSVAYSAIAKFYLRPVQERRRRRARSTLRTDRQEADGRRLRTPDPTHSRSESDKFRSATTPQLR